MSKTDLVRNSRDGDQFHYLWAARRCLKLLSEHSDLVAISIEGSSPAESSSGDPLQDGEQVIDVAEYYGDEDIEKASLVRYIQLKHSTKHADTPWTASGLKKTLIGFANRYKEIHQRFQGRVFNTNLKFCFVSNRPVTPAIIETFEDAVNETGARHPGELKKIEQFTELNGTKLSDFCRLLRFDGQQAAYWEQRNILVQELSGYLPDFDADAPVQLKELVTQKALSEHAETPTITKEDVLRVLKTDITHLFPAPCLIEESENVVQREQEDELVAHIITVKNPVIVHADGGTGKSIFATRIQYGLPAGSTCIVYDCFGSGQYRNASSYRHRHKEALVQIVNELAGKSLCHPLIPSVHADSAAYLRAFLYRLKQCMTLLRAKKQNALLCIVVDAADNAQMEAENIGESRSFAYDLLREQLPDGVRLVILCRTHRRHLLEPPPDVTLLELKPFTRAETAQCLCKKFPAASEQDIDEFHRLTSSNPRVQATALAQKNTLPNTLRSLGPNPTSVEDTIATLLDNALEKLRYDYGTTEQQHLNRICVGLAALRPFIPIQVLAAISGVEEAAVRSFALDLGRPLKVIDNAIQFFDEPAETWFIEKFKPSLSEFSSFIDILKPLAAQSAYIAAALPQLMLEADQFDELVELALTSEGLPERSPIEKRDVELQRLQFALKATLRAKRYSDAVKLSLKTGGEAAGGERQQRLLKEHTDMAALFLDAGRIQEYVSRGGFGGNWMGSHHVYEAGILSARPEFIGDARSRLRMAHEWLRNRSCLPEEERRHEKIEYEDIAELAAAHLNIAGAESCVEMLDRWKPRELIFHSGRILAQRLIDHGQYDQLNQLARSAGNNLCIILAITLELREIQRTPPANVIKRTLRLLTHPRVKIDSTRLTQWDSVQLHLRAITSLVEAGIKTSACRRKKLASLLGRYLPETPPHVLSSRFNEDSRFSFLRAYTLQAALLGQRIQLIDLAYPTLRTELEKNQSNHVDSQELRQFKENIGTFLPWHQLWADVLVGHVSPDQLTSVIKETNKLASKATPYGYREEHNSFNEIARVWMDILAEAKRIEDPFLKDFNEWIASWADELSQHFLYPKTLIRLTRVAARHSGAKRQSLEYAGRLFVNTERGRSSAEDKTNTYVNLARAVLVVSKDEAAGYFDQAVEVASKMGEESLSRWSAVLDLADRAGDPTCPAPEIAYKFARSAELTHQFVEDKYFYWTETIQVLALLCPSSSLAILSRWRDRNFGWYAELLPIAVHLLVEQEVIAPKTALVLICFRMQWDNNEILKEIFSKALTDCSDKAEQQTVAEFLYRYMRLDQQTSSIWRTLHDITTKYDIELSGIDTLIAFEKQKEEGSKSQSYSGTSTIRPKKEDEQDWDTIFSGVDLASADGVSCAYRRYKDTDPPYYHGRFFQEACERVTIGQEGKLIKAVSEANNLFLFDFFSLRSFLEHLPDSWQNRPAIRNALAEAIKKYCRQFGMALIPSRYYRPLPLEKVYDFSGVSEEQIKDIILSALGTSTELLNAESLFNLVSILAPQLTRTEALDSLSFGLNLFDDILEESDGDGSWSEALQPPEEPQTALAGYIRATLAAPQAQLRWEAAHVVCGLGTLGEKKIIADLIAMTKEGNGGPFVDRQLAFYDLHAKQWLLIALHRIAIGNSSLLADHIDFLIKTALGTEHVLIRELAAKTALKVLAQTDALATFSVHEKLLYINISEFPTCSSSLYERYTQKKSWGGRSNASFSFSVDIGPYWFRYLAECFTDVLQSEVEQRAEELIVDDWGYDDFDAWKKDERNQREIFRDRETRHSHGSYPRTDGLHFYLSYHAMMYVAGQLLATVPVHQDKEEENDEFKNWMARHALTRSDGYWLADRRDPAPLEWPDWKNERQSQDEWRWSVTREDFSRVLGISSDRLNLSGHWTFLNDWNEESINIVSALVCRERSESLLRALQTASSPYDYQIPSAYDSEAQISFGNFQLKGWLTTDYHENRIDEFDPWAGEIQHSPIIPAQLVQKTMRLSCDSEQRVWVREDNEEMGPVLWSQIWGTFRERDEREEEKGRRLQVSPLFISQLLAEIKMDLIVEVAIERNMRYSRYDSSKENDLGYIPPYTKFFLLKEDGRICTL